MNISLEDKFLQEIAFANGVVEDAAMPMSSSSPRVRTLSSDTWMYRNVKTRLNRHVNESFINTGSIIRILI